MSKRATRPRPSLEEVLQTLRDHLPDMRERYAVTSLGVFGSYVRGEARARSDLDLLVEFEQAPSFFKFVRLERHLSELLGVKVDLVMKSALKPYIGTRILNEVVPIEG